jgi:hypothetical protein
MAAVIEQRLPPGAPSTNQPATAEASLERRIRKGAHKASGGPTSILTEVIYMINRNIAML